MCVIALFTVSDIFSDLGMTFEQLYQKPERPGIGRVDLCRRQIGLSRFSNAFQSFQGDPLVFVGILPRWIDRDGCPVVGQRLFASA